MKNKKYLLAAALFCCTGCFLHAQSMQEGFFFRDYRQIYRFNPALNPGSDFVSGFELSKHALTNVGASAFLYPTADGLVTGLHSSISAGEFLGNLPDISKSITQYDFNVFSYGFARGDAYHTFEINARVPVSMSAPREAFELLKRGPVRDNYDLSRFGAKGQAYIELAYGYSRRLSDVVSIGGRVKLLAAMYGLSAKVTRFDVQMDDAGYQIAFNADLDVPSRLVDFPNVYPNQKLKLSDIRSNDRLPLPTGGGAALDLGVSVTPNEYLTLSASILDLGAVVWHYGNAAATTGYVFFNGLGTLTYDQLNEQGMKDKLKEVGNHLLDHTMLYLRGDKTRVEALTFHANLGAKYILPCYERVSVGAVASYSSYEYMPYWEARLGVEYNPFSWLDVYGSFGRGAYGNLYGFGLSAMFAKFQLFFNYQNGTCGMMPRSTTPIKANHRTWSIGLTYDL